MPRLHKNCGGTLGFTKYDSPGQYSGQWTCSRCGHSYYQRPRRSKHSVVKGDKTLSFVDIGKGVSEYIKALEKERDELNQIIHGMQEKYNLAKMNGELKVPGKYF